MSVMLLYFLTLVYAPCIRAKSCSFDPDIERSDASFESLKETVCTESIDRGKTYIR
jgi:hypothetical protein